MVAQLYSQALGSSGTSGVPEKARFYINVFAK
jgi:hypothetical protein